MGSRPYSLRHEITVVLALKAAAILVLWALFFSPAKRPTVSVKTIESGLLGSGPAGPQDRPPPAQ